MTSCYILPKKNIGRVSLIILLANLRGSDFKSLHLPQSCTLYLCWAAFRAYLLWANLSWKEKHYEILVWLFRHYPHLISEMLHSFRAHILSIINNFPSLVQMYGFHSCSMSNNLVLESENCSNKVNLVIFYWNFLLGPTEFNRQQLSRELLLSFQASISTYWSFWLVGSRAKYFSLLLNETVRERSGLSHTHTYCTADTDFLLRPSISLCVSLDKHPSDQL